MPFQAGVNVLCDYPADLSWEFLLCFYLSPTVSQLQEDDNIPVRDFPGSQEQSLVLILQQHLVLWWLGQEFWPGELCWGWALLPPAPLSSSHSINVQKRSSHQHLGPGPVAMEMERLSAHIFWWEEAFQESHQLPE